ncbi:purine-binding chemotaxis protein CheW [Anaerobranca californiensis DSM 14826]|jgi:purine-binding chemotaxis protein CheW|uniref:Chemotaxis protein CheW n=1 Tax=Anaerobranca californiensis DSM 14826 TaxID=1120989 RepID=A0A1M6KH13_9FIRM|nr:chemotaxis protein CheW [Anaerobranca californiensis]SHJ58253.1 purine-binding chemotaxis protein CheW [Anaerobranca californiensis DSM 14826]
MNEQKFVIFRLETEEYALDILKVQGIERMLPITRVPKTPNFVEGVCNLRGSIVPVVDLRQRFNLPKKENDDNTRIIVVSLADVKVGLIVDSANDVITLKSEDIEPTPSVIDSIDTKFISGVGKLGERLIIILDLEKILNKEEIVEIKEIEK